MRKMVLFMLLLGILPVINVVGKISNSLEVSEQCDSHIRYVKWKNKIGKKRSISIATYIEAYAYNNNLTISFAVPPANENIVIIVSNEEGEIIYENNVTITSIIDIPLELNETEDYLLEIYSGTSYCYGYF